MSYVVIVFVYERMKKRTQKIELASCCDKLTAVINKDQ